MLDVDERAERLRVLLYLGSEFPAVRPEQRVGELDDEDWELMRSAEQDDLDLANVLLGINAEVRSEEWAAFERLLAQDLVAADGLAERVNRLEGKALGDALHDLVELGWATI